MPASLPEQESAGCARVRRRHDRARAQRLWDALTDVDYPATKDDLLAAARRNAPDDEEVAAVLRSLPPETYANGNEVIRSAPRLRTPGEV